MRRLDLGGTWQLWSTDGRFRFAASVPGSFFYELEKSGYWGEHDVFYRENNRQCVELASRDFVYERDFELGSDYFGEHRRLFLEADGLDTLATLSLNGATLGQVENMHRRWSFPLEGRVHPGKNHLAIQFADAVKEASARQDKRPLWQVIAPLRGAMHLRKNFCSFGWDWGPQIPDVGIYRDIRVTSYLGAKLSEVEVRQHHEGGRVSLRVTPKLTRWSELPMTLALRLWHPDGREERHTLTEGQTTEIPVRDPQLWWPNGYGEQPLYRLQVNLACGAEPVDVRELRLGLRTLKMRREKDQWGESFEFVVNGVPLFARGANYIPQDVYLNRVKVEDTRRLLESARDANFNCLRVWGGGIYPHDHFFDLCDELGIIIWQDMMFSCAIYDVHNPVFHENIKEEARDNLERIRHHACLGLICGNNEMEWGFEAWGFPHTKEHRVEYLKQYEVLLPAVAKEVCPDVDYWPASPSSGGHFDEPNHPDRGDVHYWDVWHGRKSYTEFRKHHFRFLSEFGFQAFPNIKTLESFTEPEDRNIFTPVMEDHQRNDSDNGNAKIFHFIADYYRYPKDFASIVYVSQLSQGEALRYAVEHLRQNRGRCMGATYWQLNDNWPVVSWSSVDYFGRWKAMHYVARRVYDPLLLSVREEKTQAKIYLCNERREGTHGRLSWQLLSLSGEVIRSGSTGIEVGPLHAQCLVELDFTAELAANRGRQRYLSVVYEDHVTGRHFHTTASFVPFKYLDLKDPKLSWSLSDGGAEHIITVRAGSFAKFVELDLERADAVFSDNYFDLDPGVARDIKVAKAAIDAQTLRQQLKVRSLFDSFTAG